MLQQNIYKFLFLYVCAEAGELQLRKSLCASLSNFLCNLFSDHKDYTCNHKKIGKNKKKSKREKVKIPTVSPSEITWYIIYFQITCWLYLHTQTHTHTLLKK